MQSFTIQTASSSAFRTLRRDFTRSSSCRRLVLRQVAGTVTVSSNHSSPLSSRAFSTHPSTSTGLRHTLSRTRTLNQQQRDQTYRTYTTKTPPSSSSQAQQEHSQFPESEGEPITFPDPHRSDLFYHYTPAPTPLSPVLPAFALSFLEVLPFGADGGQGSEAVIGWLPAQVSMEGEGAGTKQGEGTQGQGEGSTLDDFVGNDRFLGFLHSTIQSALEQGKDEIWRDAAIALGSGWMHIGDQRNIPALGRVGDPDDILASVLVQDGQILPGTYQAMPSYRICTADGVLQLTPGLAGCLKEALTKLSSAAGQA